MYFFLLILIIHILDLHYFKKRRVLHSFSLWGPVLLLSFLINTRRLYPLSRIPLLPLATMYVHSLGVLDVGLDGNLFYWEMHLRRVALPMIFNGPFQSKLFYDFINSTIKNLLLPVFCLQAQVVLVKKKTCNFYVNSVGYRLFHLSTGLVTASWNIYHSPFVHRDGSRGSLTTSYQKFFTHYYTDKESWNTPLTSLSHHQSLPLGWILDTLGTPIFLSKR